MQVTSVRNNHVKNHVKLILEAHFGIFCVFVFLCTTMYAHENSPLPHELSYFQLFKFSHLNLFHENAICKK
jgi:hypothetical protein